MADWESAITGSTRNFVSRVRINGANYDDDNVVEIKIDETVNPEDTFALGSVAATKMTIELIDIGAVELQDAEIKPEIGLLIDEEYSYVPLGTYYVDDIDKKNNKVILTCFDSMSKMEKPYSSSLNYPAPINQVALEIAQKTGVTLVSTLPNTMIPKMDDVTLRQAIGYIATFVGGFARFNRNNELEVTSYKTTTKIVTADNYFGDLITQEKPFQIGKIGCRVPTEDGYTELTAGTGGIGIVFEHPFMTQAQLNSIYNNIKNLVYMPYTMKWQGDPMVSSGDKIKIVDINDVEHETIIMNQTLRYAGGFSAESSATGETENANEFNWKGSLTERVEDLENKVEQGESDDPTPAKPTNVQADGAFKVIMLSWDYNDSLSVKNYEAYASRTKGFVPSSSNLVYAGDSSAFNFYANVNETWYFRIRAINRQDVASSFSDEATGKTVQIDGDTDIAPLTITNQLIAENAAIDFAKIANVEITNAMIKEKLHANKIIVGPETEFLPEYDPTKIEVGGRNLLLNSRYDYEGITHWSTYNGATLSGVSDDRFGRVLKITTPNDNYFVQNRMFEYRKEGLEKGKYVTISFYVRSDTSTSAIVTIRTTGVVNNIINQTTFPITNEWRKIVITEEILMNTADLVTSTSWGLLFSRGEFNSEYYIAELQVEHGNKATDYGLAQEDITSSISSAQTTANEAMSVIINNKSNWDRASILNADGTLNSDKLKGKLTDSQLASAQKWNGQGVYIDENGVYTGTLVANQIVSGRISSEFIAIGDDTQFMPGYDPTKIEISGRNLISGTSNEYRDANHTIFYSILETIKLEDVGLKVGDTITVSVYVRAHTDYDDRLRLRWHSEGNTNHANSYGDYITKGTEGRLTLTATIPANTDNFYIALEGRPNGTAFKSQYKELQLEKGNKATGWSIAPEDIPKGTYIDQSGVYTGTLIANQIKSGTIEAIDIVGSTLTSFNAATNDVVVIESGKIEYFEDGIITARIDADGQFFYRDNKLIGKIGTNNWVGDTSYRSLAFNLEYETSYLSWSAKLTAGATTYATLLTWHRTDSHDYKGFNFYDDVRIGGDYTLSLSSISTTGYVNGDKKLEFQNVTGTNKEGIRIAHGNANINLYSNSTIDIGGDVHINGDLSLNWEKALQVYRFRTTSSPTKIISFDNWTVDGIDGVALRRGADFDGAGVFMTNRRAALVGVGNVGVATIEAIGSGDYGYIKSMPIYNRTYTTSTQLVRVAVNGILGRVESTERAKLLIEPIELEHAKKIHGINSVTWFDKRACEEYAHTLSTGEVTEEQQIVRIPGLIAEHVYDAGLTEFVSLDGEGLPTGINDNLWTLLIPISSEHEERLDSHDVLLSEYDQRFGTIESRIETLEQQLQESKGVA